MLLWQLGSVLKLPLISFLGIQCRLLHKCDYLLLSCTQSQGFSCGRISHLAWFIQGWIASLDLWSHHVKACLCIQPHLVGMCTRALLWLLGIFPGCCKIKNQDLNRFGRNLVGFVAAAFMLCVRLLCFLHLIPKLRTNAKASNTILMLWFFPLLPIIPSQF